MMHEHVLAICSLAVISAVGSPIDHPPRTTQVSDCPSEGLHPKDLPQTDRYIDASYMHFINLQDFVTILPYPCHSCPSPAWAGSVDLHPSGGLILLGKLGGGVYQSFGGGAGLGLPRWQTRPDPLHVNLPIFIRRAVLVEVWT